MKHRLSVGWRRALALCCVALGAIASPAAAQDRAVPESRTQIDLSFAPLVKQVAPAVVNVFTRKTVTSRPSSPLFDDPFFRRFFGEGFPSGPAREQEQSALGSGVIVDGTGVVVTNNHVIDGADEITVVLADRREFAAEILGVDERSDLAVLRMREVNETLPHLQYRDSDTIEVGDLVMAVGNPFGIGQTVTTGIVSALARTTVGVADFRFFIQTDAAINPGNSGGALVTMDGRLAGINTAIYSRDGGSLGIGFAVPANMVRAVVAGIVGGGLRRPWIGFTGQDVTSDMASSLGLPRPGGVIVQQVYPGGPADRAGLQSGDIVAEIEGREVVNSQGLRFRFATMAPDGTTSIVVWRRGRPVTLTLPLEPPPENPARDVTEVGPRSPLTGAVVANLSPALADEIGIDPFLTGVIILQIRRGSIAERLGFQPGDLLRAVNGAEVDAVGQLLRAVERRPEDWRIEIERDGRRIALQVRG
jgi:Do/DeqQ family serine protease